MAKHLYFPNTYTSESQQVRTQAAGEAYLIKLRDAKFHTDISEAYFFFNVKNAARLKASESNKRRQFYPKCPMNPHTFGRMRDNPTI